MVSKELTLLAKERKNPALGLVEATLFNNQSARPARSVESARGRREYATRGCRNIWKILAPPPR